MKQLACALAFVGLIQASEPVWSEITPNEQWSGRKGVESVYSNLYAEGHYTNEELREFFIEDVFQQWDSAVVVHLYDEVTNIDRMVGDIWN